MTIRTLKFIAGTGGHFSLTITQGKKTTTYAVAPIRSDDGAGFEVVKLDDEGHIAETYHVELYPSSGHHSCDCLGALRHGHCKHIAALVTLEKAGKISLKEKVR